MPITVIVRDPFFYPASTPLAVGTSVSLPDDLAHQMVSSGKASYTTAPTPPTVDDQLRQVDTALTPAAQGIGGNVLCVTAAGAVVRSSADAQSWSPVSGDGGEWAHLSLGLLPSPSVAMSAPPAAALNTAVTHPQQIPYTDGRLALLGASWTLQTGQARVSNITSDPSGSGAAYSDPTTPYNTAASGGVYFNAATSSIEVRFVGTYCRVSVYNAQTRGWEVANTTAGVNGSTRYLVLTFSDSAPRSYKVEISGVGSQAYFHSVYLPASATLWAYTPRRLRGICITDSFGDGTGAAYVFDGGYQLIGGMLGADEWRVCASGGTGLVATNGALNRGNVVTRLSADVLTKGARDLIVLPLSGNDTPWVASVAANVSTCLQQLRAAFPAARIVVVGCWRPNDTAEAAYNAVDTAAQAGIAASGVACDWISQVGWITGSGRVGATTGGGNADVYTSADGTHPSPAGHVYRAQRLAAAIRDALLASVA